MRLFRTTEGICVGRDGQYFRVSATTWDDLVAHGDLHGHHLNLTKQAEPESDFQTTDISAAIGSQEVWAAGVTYFGSRDARMEEAKNAGGGNPLRSRLSG